MKTGKGCRDKDLNKEREANSLIARPKYIHGFLTTVFPLQRFSVHTLTVGNTVTAFLLPRQISTSANF